MQFFFFHFWDILWFILKENETEWNKSNYCIIYKKKIVKLKKYIKVHVRRTNQANPTKVVFDRKSQEERKFHIIPHCLVEILEELWNFLLNKTEKKQKKNRKRKQRKGMEMLDKNELKT